MPYLHAGGSKALDLSTAALAVLDSLTLAIFIKLKGKKIIDSQRHKQLAKDTRTIKWFSGGEG